MKHIGPHTKESIRELLESNDLAVARAVLRLYQRQTTDEQSVEHTKHKNFRGFNAGDAPFLTSIAKFFERNKYLSPKQTFVARKRVLKYTKQLTDIANLGLEA